MPHPDTSPDEREITIKDTLNYLKEAGGDYMKSKAELAALEAKEAASEGVNKAVKAVLLIFFALFSYILLLATAIGVGSKLLAGKISFLATVEQHIGTWPIVSFALLLIHLLFVFIFLDKLKNSNKKDLFTHTKAELEKDKLWLQQIKAKNES